MTSRAEALQLEHEWRDAAPYTRPEPRSELERSLRTVERIERRARWAGIALGVAAALSSFSLGLAVLAYFGRLTCAS